MVKHRVAFAATLAAALTACGTDDARSDVQPEPELENPEAYFGLDVCTCYEYVPVGGGNEVLGIAVESVTDTVAGSGGNMEHVVRYRRNGAEIRQDVYRPTDPDLLLRQVTIGSPAAGTIWQSSPPVPWLRFPVESGKQVTQDATFTEFGGDQTEEVAFVANYLAEQVQASTDGGEPETFDAVRISYQGLPFSELPRWFVPETGFVRVELDIEGTRTRWQLANKRVLEGGCPWEPGEQIGDTCSLPD
ncbi:hypothetical protein [Vulgatibacter sp.]|uniref:hypothetical protein n=1 Tax=Vulgatibacter sp. TaxID=1971226 RepID=UPI0035697082